MNDHPRPQAPPLRWWHWLELAGVLFGLALFFGMLWIRCHPLPPEPGNAPAPQPPAPPAPIENGKKPPDKEKSKRPAPVPE